MPYILTAVNCPAVPLYAGLASLSAGPLTSPTFVTGATTGVVAKLNEAGARQDFIGRYGSGGYSILAGLDLSDGGGLTLDIAAGHAMIDGIVAIADTTAALTNGGRNHIWLSRAGAIVVQFATLTQPAGAHAYLGSALTAAGVISSVDQSGVMYLPPGGFQYRRTADTTTPADTPPTSVVFLHLGPGANVWLWTGSQYVDLETVASPLAVVDGGTGATTPAGARTALGVGREGQFAVAINASYAIAAADTIYSQLELQQGSIGAPFTFTFPSAASMLAAGTVAGHVWVLRNDTNYPCRVSFNLGNEWFLPEQAQMHLYFDGVDGFEIAQTYPTYGSLPLPSGNWTPTTFDQTLKTFWDIEADGANRTANFVANTGNQRGRMFAVRSSDGSSTMLTVKTSGGPADKETVLLPGELNHFTMLGDGQLLAPRPYTRRVVKNFTTDTNMTLASPDYLASIIEITDTGVVLTTTRSVILPLVDHHSWSIYNATAQSLTIIGATGTGVTLATLQGALFYSDATNFYRMGAAAARA